MKNFLSSRWPSIVELFAAFLFGGLLVAVSQLILVTGYVDTTKHAMSLGLVLGLLAAAYGPRLVGLVLDRIAGPEPQTDDDTDKADA